MGMRPVEGGFIDIPAKGQAELKMGGLHIMCIDKLDDFQEGTVLTVTLSFEKSGEKSIEVESGSRICKGCGRRSTLKAQIMFFLGEKPGL